MLAILFWSTNIAFSRTVMESLGPLTAGSYIYLLGGALGCLALLAKGQLAISWRLPRKYLFWCGTFFVTNMVSFYLAIGLASGRQQVLEVGLINYLWPGLTLLFSIPILHKKARLTLVPGMVLVFAGMFLATMQQESLSWTTFLENCRLNFLPYLMALLGAIAWGLYSCYNRALGTDVRGDATPFFLLAAGLVLGGIGLFTNETSAWAMRAVAELVYVATFPTFVAYACWDISMRKGNVVFLAALSYFIPLVSTLISAVHLHTPMGLNLWLACGLVIGGALVCKWSIVEKKA